MVLPTISVPYEDVMKLKEDSTELKNVIELLNTEFPDDTCQLIAIKSILGIETEKEPSATTEPTDPVDPSEPSTDPEP